jgi:hypothetical protein
MRFAGLLALLTFVSPCLGPTTPAIADDAKPNRIRIEYVPPKNPAHQAIYDTMKERHALETVQKIFSPFKLPIDLTVKTMGCDGVSNAYFKRPELVICYEYLDDVRKRMPKETTPIGLTPADTVIGQFFFTAGHEMGHALFALLDVPLWGRPEDAADSFSAYMMLLLGKDEARRLIGGAAFSYKKFVLQPTMTIPQTAFADEHGASMQRFYNLLCISYGANQELFADLVDKGYLPKRRASRCKREYEEIAFAFDQTIKPHIDEDLAIKVMSKTWLPEVKR